MSDTDSDGHGSSDGRKPTQVTIVFAFNCNFNFHFHFNFNVDVVSIGWRHFLLAVFPLSFEGARHFERGFRSVRWRCGSGGDHPFRGFEDKASSADEEEVPHDTRQPGANT